MSATGTAAQKGDRLDKPAWKWGRKRGMMETLYQMTPDERRMEAFRIAEALYRQTPDWVTFFREILGIGGVMRRLFPDREGLVEFEKSAEYSEIQWMLALATAHRHSSSRPGTDTRDHRAASAKPARSRCRRKPTLIKPA